MLAFSVNLLPSLQGEGGHFSTVENNTVEIRCRGGNAPAANDEP